MPILHNFQKLEQQDLLTLEEAVKREEAEIEKIKKNLINHDERAEQIKRKQLVINAYKRIIDIHAGKEKLIA